jgi:hypothetical protein
MEHTFLNKTGILSFSPNDEKDYLANKESRGKGIIKGSDDSLYEGDVLFKDGLYYREGEGKISFLKPTYDTYYHLYPAYYVGHVSDFMAGGPYQNGIYYFLNKKKKPTCYCFGYWTGRDKAGEYEKEKENEPLLPGFHLGMGIEYYSHEEQLHKILTKNKSQEITTLFVGDSYFEIWNSPEWAGLNTFNHVFPSDQYLNCGLGGTTIKMWQVYLPIIANRGLKIKNIDIHLGFNDLHIYYGDYKKALKDMESLLELVKYYFPTSHLFMDTMVNCPHFKENWDKEELFNEGLKKLALSKQIAIIDWCQLFHKANGEYNSYFYKDLVHPGPKGYELVIPILKALL